jgi:hypothetical protein
VVIPPVDVTRSIELFWFVTHKAPSGPVTAPQGVPPIENWVAWPAFTAKAGVEVPSRTTEISAITDKNNAIVLPK